MLSNTSRDLQDPICNQSIDLYGKEGPKDLQDPNCNLNKAH